MVFLDKGGDVLQTLFPSHAVACAFQFVDGRRSFAKPAWPRPPYCRNQSVTTIVAPQHLKVIGLGDFGYPTGSPEDWWNGLRLAPSYPHQYVKIIRSATRQMRLSRQNNV